MSRHLIRLAALLMVAVLAPVTAQADETGCRLIDGAETTDPADDVEVCRQQVWIHEGESKVGNVDGRDGVFPGWDTTAPTASVAAGAGGGYAGSSVYQLSAEWDPTYTPAFEGAYNGAVDNVMVEMHLFPLVHMAEQAGDVPDAELAVDANLFIDGQMVASHGGLPVEAEMAGDAVRVVRFVFADFYGRPNTGPGDHDIRLELVGTGLAGDAAAWVYDTTEVPSNLVFNATADEIEGLPGVPLVWGE